MVETPDIASNFLRQMFGVSTESNVYLSSLPNPDAGNGHASERHVTTRDGQDVARFVRKWDQRNRALYFCVSTIKPGVTRRAKETLAELNGLHTDIDFKSVDDTPEEIEQKLAQVMLPPTTVVASGHGLHAYWLLREALPATSENIAELEVLLRLLADHLGGDLAVCEAARLMRLPGSHNSKNGAWLEVKTLVQNGPRYELYQLNEWLTIVSPIIRRKTKTNGRDDVDDDINPFLAAAQRLGFTPPIDVEQRLAAMRYQGAGETGIHTTQVSVSAALLSRGTPLEDVVAVLLDATRAAAGPFGQHWNWQREEHAIRRMCDTWLAKHPPASTDTGKTAEETRDNKAEAEPKAKSKARAKTRSRASSHDMITAMADGVIESVRQQGREILLTGGDLWLYQEGVWRMADGGDVQSLKVLIQEGAQTLGQSPRIALLNSAWRRLTEHPDLHRANVDWDNSPDHIAVENGTLNLVICKLGDWRPDYYLRRKLAVAFEPGATAPMFAGFLASLFQDCDEETRSQSIAILQEFFGLCLAPRKLNREQRRALLLVGPSRVGKTELARVVRRLIGGTVAAPAVSEIGERFGLACFIDAQGWIRDDAINEGDRLDPERFKTVVTGEAIDIERKNRSAVTLRLNIPVLLTANMLPTARDSSDAIFNRCLVLELTHVFEEGQAVAFRKLAGVPPGMNLADWLFEQEGPGILNWALDGLVRLLERGQFDIPAHVAAAIQDFKDESNGVSEFARSMLTRSDTTMIHRTDLLCAFQGWWREEMGDDVRLLGARWLMPKIKAACPWTSDIKKHPGNRFVAGIALTEAGLRFWQRQSSDHAQSKRGVGGNASGPEAVNRTKDQSDAETVF